jgi:hypothetical protein
MRSRDEGLSQARRLRVIRDRIEPAVMWAMSAMPPKAEVIQDISDSAACDCAATDNGATVGCVAARSGTATRRTTVDKRQQICRVRESHVRLQSP